MVLPICQFLELRESNPGLEKIVPHWPFGIIQRTRQVITASYRTIFTRVNKNNSNKVACRLRGTSLLVGQKVASVGDEIRLKNKIARSSRPV